MKIDNSQMTAWHKCPQLFYERYEARLEPAKRAEALLFGTRMHELLEEQYRTLQNDPIPPYPEAPDYAIESEAAVTLAAYLNTYSVEPFSVVAVEHTFEVAIPGTAHTYTGKFDLVVREHDSGMLSLLDHKTEGRRSFTNDPESWAMRSQATLYLWAAQELYGETPRSFVVNRIRRQSPKGQEPVEFYRDAVKRSPEQMTRAVRDIVWVADQIEEMRRLFGNQEPWPADTNQCKQGPFKCPYYALHAPDADRQLVVLKHYRPAEDYLGVGEKDVAA